MGDGSVEAAIAYREPQLELTITKNASSDSGAVGLGRRSIRPHACPDLVRMDVRMPDLDGIAATHACSPIQPRTKCLS
jgi:CheY-like chemotaxis protein